MSRVSVVILSWNTAELTVECLRSVEAAFERGLAFAEEYPEAAKTLKDHHETWQQGSEQNKAAEKLKSPPPAAPASPPVQTSLSAPEQ